MKQNDERQEKVKLTDARKAEYAGSDHCETSEVDGDDGGEGEG